MNLRYWSRNSKVLENPEINIKFSELIRFTESELESWIDKMRDYVAKVWDETGIPPLNGKTHEAMESDFREMKGFPVGKLLVKDELTGKKNVIKCDTSLGSIVNQFHPTMLKVAVNQGTKTDGYSVYDLFTRPELRKRMQSGCRRHFRRDSFYHYSESLEKNTEAGIVSAKDAVSWCTAFSERPALFSSKGYWLNEVDPSKNQGSGYTMIDSSKFLFLLGIELKELLSKNIVKTEHITNIKEIKDDFQYHIRFYDNETRIFPIGFTAFKIGYWSIPVNFPPLIAKYLWETYTSHIKGQEKITVYDPSSGWSGRITGAMIASKPLHYVGTDPNPDNVLPDFNISRYEYVADFVRKSTKNGSLMSLLGEKQGTCELFRDGSEVIKDNPRFHKYKGKLDMVFTSPPYWGKEAYSDDPNQSFIKFGSSYEAWRDGFLRPTLETAVEYLKNDRYLLWNIADPKMGEGGSYLPLEQDSIDILTSLGMEYIDTLRMSLKSMPGANRMGSDGIPSCKNYCKVGGRYLKFEPIFVFRKP